MIIDLGGLILFTRCCVFTSFVLCICCGFAVRYLSGWFECCGLVVLPKYDVLARVGFRCFWFGLVFGCVWMFGLL